jgi:CheY-like chemotaxis protein
VSGRERIAPLLEVLERMAAGEHGLRAPISGAHDELDAMAHAVNILVGELDYALPNQRSVAELAEKANGAKTALLRNVSHEMRTPLAAILSISEVLQSPGLTDERRHALSQRIHAHGRRLLGLIDNLLDLSCLESGPLELDRSSLSARAALADAAEKLGPEAQQRGIRLVIDAPADLDDRVLADPRRVRQILDLLFGAALRRATQGEIRVRLSRDSRATVAIEIVDRSPRRALHDEGALPDDSVGLVLARRLARAMEGDVTIADDVFKLSLASAPEAKPAPMPRALRGRRLLLAEDDDDIREATACLLELEGVDVRAVSDGDDAIELTTRERFDVIVMDIRMPRLDGLTATRRIRALGVTVPIVALTADAVAEQRQECLNAGCNAHLLKPVDINQLLALLAQVIEGASK